jgi:predicted enzyme related to lactoylglutathione lyase
MIVIESEDVKTDFNEFKDAGATIVAEPYQPDEKQPDIWLATVADPDNNYIQISTPWSAKS